MLVLALVPELTQGGEAVSTESNYIGLALLLAAGLFGGWLLRRLARHGIAGAASERMNLGLGQGLVALGSILQPHTPGPEDLPGAYTERDDDHRGRKPDPDRAPVLFEDGELPADGLRIPLPHADVRARRQQASNDPP